MIADMMPGTEEQLQKEMTSAYVGIDPTADSLHIGHLVSVMMLKHLQRAGHRPIALVGGATGMIGDPSMKSAERNLLDEATLRHNQDSIKKQLSKFLDFDSDAPNAAKLVNNYDWMKDYSFLNFIRDIGKHITVNYMMAKESVKKRIETGISYTEFAYQIMQGYDFYVLNQEHNVTLQIGGSDQWGNMTAGTELMRRKADKTGHVMTVPLITDATGKKFGKSEGNAVWLNADKTSPYEMYQFWLNVMDDDAVRFLKIFTFLSLEEIEEIGKEFDQARHQRLAQKILAREVVTLVHGKEAYEQAVHITEQLFAGNLKALSARDLKVALNGVPTYEISADENLNIVELLVNAKISPSKRQAREDVQNGAIYINGERVQDLDYTLSDTDKIDNEITVIRRGKKKNFVLTY